MRFSKDSTLLRETTVCVALEQVLLSVHNHEATSLVDLPDVSCAEVAHTNDGDEVLIVVLLDLWVRVLDIVQVLQGYSSLPPNTSP